MVTLVNYNVNPLQAWLKLVQMEREEAEKERQKEEEERRKRKEEAKRRSRILEAAFDGDNDEILAVLDEVKNHRLFTSRQSNVAGGWKPF